MGEREAYPVMSQVVWRAVVVVDDMFVVLVV